ncbi:MAG: hypothetical protein V7L29_09205 [Nostoc sp.]|uniref:hypothetical protein n=1 Tax=Nostoc sp. TaxID=1180 RepID=UPI002FFC0B48
MTNDQSPMTPVASNWETPYSPSLRDAPRTGILRQALASPFGRRLDCRRSYVTTADVRSPLTSMTS